MFEIKFRSANLKEPGDVNISRDGTRTPCAPTGVRVRVCVICRLKVDTGWGISGGGGEGEGACAPGGTFQGVGHFKEDKKSVCVRSFKCFTAFDIRAPEVFCDV